jgi:hypothetical protein
VDASRLEAFRTEGLELMSRAKMPTQDAYLRCPDALGPLLCDAPEYMYLVLSNPSDPSSLLSFRALYKDTLL